ncbi:disulfide bond formation protein B [Undibacterium seohonense]|jgi:disulfide bond formation protein DsbB|uniref:Disulfide bond formation protein B n=1 Tax=Undibacterium seohonense TaxID=1344950 RepID=A0ABR6X1N2_9BURK|nr:disulfide bond formation protein B [Undibacterium seohonense]MBC3806766.1 disulfide bond formation protein B [Undibacterium seohonense]
MNRTKALLITIILACLGLLGFAMYLQLVLDMLPCPFCVIQRYAFALIALVCLLSLFKPKFMRGAMSASLSFSLIGGGIASYQLWVIAQPLGSCGADLWSGPINSLFPAKLFPVMFRANGLCETPYDPILGLSIPTWALVWFLVFAVASIYLLVTKPKEPSIFANKL